MLCLHRPTYVTLLAFGIAANVAVAQVPSSLPRLLGPSTPAAVRMDAKSAGAAVQARTAQPDAALVEQLARDHVARSAKPRFVVDLFPGLELEAEVIAAETRASGSSVFARLTEVELGSVVLTYEAGVLLGSIDFPGGNYVVTPQPDGSYRVAKVATQLHAPERDPRQRPSVAPAMPELAIAEPDVPTDSGRLIDVMILWTPSAQTAAGGPYAIQALAQASIDNANLTYLNSGIAQRLRLVHQQQVNYTERTSCGASAFDCALDDITYSGDGYLDEVHALRNTHGADLVSLLIDDYAYCGIAWLPQPPSAWTSDQGFSIVDQSCAVGNKSFVHELGHNMGAHHDPYVAAGPGAYPYSHGIVNLTQRWRDVMAYNNQCNASGFYCNRIQYMSNPKLTYASASLGDAGVRNNSHTLNKTAKAIAAYRATSPLHPLVPRFTDVPAGNASFGYIEFFAQAGITSGCTGAQFCPNDSVTRRQMAVFLERGMKASNWAPPAPAGLFSDVPAGSQFRDFIEALYNDSVTSGCATSPLRYCPDQVVTRAQMAVFVLRARCGSSYVPNLPSSQRFGDVPPSHPFYRYIDKLAAFNITQGCTATMYCPDQPVTRAQMATFFERAYPFLAPSESCAL